MARVAVASCFMPLIGCFLEAISTFYEPSCLYVCICDKSHCFTEPRRDRIAAIDSCPLCPSRMIIFDREYSHNGCNITRLSIQAMANGVDHLILCYYY